MLGHRFTGLHLPLAIAVLVIGSWFAACGGSDGDGGDTTTPTPPPGETPVLSPSPGDPLANCAALPYAISLRAADGAELGFDEETFLVTDARVVSLGDGAGYTIYLADFELPAEFTLFTEPAPPGDGTLVTLFVTTFNPPATPVRPEPGMVIEYTPDFGTLSFGMIIQRGEVTYNSFATASGSLAVTQTGEAFCGEIDYVDSASADISQVQNRLKGAIAAEVVATF